VKVDGEIVCDLGRKVDMASSTITVDEIPVKNLQGLRYYMFHKPKGYLTTLSDPQNRPTVLRFLEKLPARVYPVGRLDMDVSGLLILTNDGELAKRLMHPSYMIPKVYRARVEGVPDEGALKLLTDGSLIIGGKPISPAKARVLPTGPDKGWLELTLTEGRHRQVKRMCAACGHPVIELKRVCYCDLKLPSHLLAGQISELTSAQLQTLLKKVGLATKDKDTVA
jgi:pseudouridine synthase